MKIRLKVLDCSEGKVWPKSRCRKMKKFNCTERKWERMRKWSEEEKRKGDEGNEEVTERKIKEVEERKERSRKGIEGESTEKKYVNKKENTELY